LKDFIAKDISFAIKFQFSLGTISLGTVFKSLVWLWCLLLLGRCWRDMWSTSLPKVLVLST